MKPIVKLAEVGTPDGGRMALFEHDGSYTVKVNGQELMNSRQHESELELARLGCGHLKDRNAPHVLIGGLGMGYTLRQTLEMLSPKAHVLVGELMGAVVKWNREYLHELSNHALDDPRVELRIGNVAKVIEGAERSFDAILLDVDNGPSAMTHSGNHRLYGPSGIESCRRALCERGILAVWSSEPSKPYEQRLVNAGFQVRRFRVPAYKGRKPSHRFIWVASENKGVLPVGGGEPHIGSGTPLKRRGQRRR